MERPAHGGNLAWAAPLAGCSPDAILDFSASINPAGLPASAIAAIQSHLGDLTAYPDPSYSQLRTALAQFHGLSADWILPGNGSAELLTWACRELAEQDGTYLLLPAFGDYWRALNAFQAKVIGMPLPLQPIPLSPDATAPQWLDEGPSTAANRGLLLNNPHNPTGQLFLRQTLMPYLERFSLVVVDEAFMDFLPPSQQQSLIEAVCDHPNLVVLRSLTKFYSLPGLRLGYAIAHPDRLQRWQRWRDPWSVNALAAAVGAAVVQDEAFQQRTWDWMATVQPAFFQGLASLPGLTPFASAANFFLVQSVQPVPPLQTQLLQHHHILIRDCLSFPELGDRYFRVAVRTPAENQRLLTGLADILEKG